MYAEIPEDVYGLHLIPPALCPTCLETGFQVAIVFKQHKAHYHTDDTTREQDEICSTPLVEFPGRGGRSIWLKRIDGGAFTKNGCMELLCIGLLDSHGTTSFLARINRH